MPGERPARQLAPRLAAAGVHAARLNLGDDAVRDSEPLRRRVLAPQPDAPAIGTIVEECFPREALHDLCVFFDAAGDETRFKANLERMMTSVHRFIDPGTRSTC